MDKTNKNPNVPNLRFNNDVFKIKKIGEIFELITGGTPSTKNKMYWNGDVPWMPSGDIYIMFLLHLRDKEKQEEQVQF